jgi:hypothetical protein
MVLLDSQHKYIMYMLFCSDFFGERKYIMRQQGVCHIVALPFTLKNILRQKKNYGNSNISIAKT